MTRKPATVALGGFKRQLFDVDPNNEKHLDAYINLRSLNQRVKPEAFIAHLKSTLESQHTAQQAFVEYCVVPSANSVGHKLTPYDHGGKS